ncbi:hypothetical protein BU25DRAFT_330572, partial [Macroventuria anomochaeta]
TTKIEVRNLGVVIGYNHNSCFAQLHYGDVALIDVRDSNCMREEKCKQSLRWFCEEVDFLACEFRARESAAAEILRQKAATNLKSRIVKLKAGKRKLVTEKKVECGNAKKWKRLRLPLRLWNDAVVDG